MGLLIQRDWDWIANHIKFKYVIKHGHKEQLLDPNKYCTSNL